MVLPLPMRMGSLDAFVDSTRARLRHGDAKLILIDDLFADFYTAIEGDPPIERMTAALPGSDGAPSPDDWVRPDDDAERLVILRHGLRNAGITILSVVGLQIAGLAASGSVVVEAIFSWPGVGDLLVNAALRRDYPVLQFGVVVVSVAVLAISALTDLAYAWVDPRLRRAAQGGAG